MHDRYNGPTVKLIDVIPFNSESYVAKLNVGPIRACDSRKIPPESITFSAICKGSNATNLYTALIVLTLVYISFCIPVDPLSVRCYLD